MAVPKSLIVPAGCQWMDSLSSTFITTLMSVQKLFKLFTKQGKKPITPDELERRFWEAENDRTQVYERSRRQQQYDFALATEPWFNAEDTRTQLFQRFILDALDTFAKNQQERTSSLNETLERHGKIARASDEARQELFEKETIERMEVFQATQRNREAAITKWATNQEELYEMGRRQRRGETEEIYRMLRELFGKMIREEREAFIEAQCRREQRVRSTVMPLPTPYHPVLRPHSVVFASPVQPPIITRSPSSELYRPGTCRVSLRRPSFPSTEVNTSPPVIVTMNSRRYSASILCRRSQSPTKRISVTSQPLKFSTSEKVGQESEQLDTLQNDNAHTLSQRLDAAFQQCEDQRQDTFLADERNRATYFSSVKAYVNDSAMKRLLHFKQTRSDLDVRLSSLTNVGRERLRALEHEHNALEALREQTFSGSDARMKAAFDDMLSLMEHNSSCMEIVQNEHAEACYQEVDALLDAMASIVIRIRNAMSRAFEDLMSSRIVTVPPKSPTAPPSPIASPDIPSEEVAYEQSRSSRRGSTCHSRGRSWSRSPPAHRATQFYSRRSRSRSRSGRRSYISTRRSPSPSRVARPTEPFVCSPL
ncbi:hypothetical protein BXZ70DRAFT_79840 [Cristinia sonorae]|uniref:Uncharacterized protein n=1 Tax=Cristinia sonorae TaxID=1940300 RepID=A0A8K0XR54_9AGAR|nr:hypothetical protein BXZ70DRAFT_79840 [Cristinia sonorae]